MKLLFTIIICLTQLRAFSTQGDSLAPLKRLKFYFSLDIRRSLVRDIPISIAGFKIGATFKQRHTVGLGYYNMGRPWFGYYISRPVDYDANQSLVNRSGRLVDVETNVSLSMHYVSLFYEYRILALKRWNLDWTAQYGIGEAYINAINVRNGLRIPGYPKSNGIHLLESSFMLQYRIFTWAGVGAGFGYRYMLNPNEYIATTFNYPIWVLKIIISPGKILKVFRGKEKWYK